MHGSPPPPLSRRASTRRVLGAATAAGLAIASLAAGATTTYALPSASATTLAGANRYATAATITEAKFPNGVASVVLVSGLNFPDALSAAFLAGSERAGILLTNPDTLPPETAQALSQLKVRNITVVGGTDAVSDAVATQLASTPSTATPNTTITVSRVSGDTRYDTNQAVVTAPGTTVGTINGAPTAIIASGTSFFDALAAGGLSYSAGLPIILTDPSTLSPQAASALNTLGITQALIMGGTDAVSVAVESAINAAGVTTLKRFAGVDRFDTASQLATYEVTNLSFNPTKVILTRSDDFADALAGAAYAGDPVPLLPAGLGGSSCRNLNSTTAGFITGEASSLSLIVGFGGADAVCAAELDQAVTDAGGFPGAPTPGSTTEGELPSTTPNTAAPDLVSASLAGPNNYGGSTPTIVKFTFDKDIRSAAIVNPTIGRSLRLIGYNVTGGYSTTATNYVSGDSSSCVADSNNVSVDCQYPPSVNVTQYTIAVADTGAVMGISPALGNPLGSVPFSGSTGVSGGSYPGPLLIGAQVVEGTQQIIYQFNMPITPGSVVPADFVFYVSDGSEFNDGTLASTPNGSTVAINFSKVDPPVTNAVKEAVQNGAVTSATTPAIASAAGSAGSPVTPDLISVNRVVAAPNAFDFTFDVGALSGLVPANFFVFFSNTTTGTPVAGIGAADINNTTVRVLFPSGTITQANTNLVTLGAVTDGAASQNGPVPGANSIGDEPIGGGSATGPGAANGPVLQAVAGTGSTDTVSYTFNGPISTSAPTATGPNSAAFFVVTPSGTLVFPGAGATISTSGKVVTVNFGATSIIGDVGAGFVSLLGDAAPSATGGTTAAEDFNSDFNAPADLPMTVN